MFTALTRACMMSGASRMGTGTSQQFVTGLGTSQRVVVDRHRGKPKFDPTGWTNCEVSQKTFETPEVVSLVLTPLSGQTIKPHQAGQFINLKVLFGEQEVYRKYSLSSIANGKNVTISVKREPEGLVSSYLFDEFAVGQTIDVYFPRGDFTLEPSTLNTKPVVLITAGIGISPVISMVHELQHNAAFSGRPVHFIHSAKTRSLHAFRGMLQRLHLSNSNFKYFVRYSQDQPPETEPEVPEATKVRYGRLTEQDLREWLPADRDAEVYFLGPVPFMACLKRSLTRIGVPPQNLHWEFFTKRHGKDLDAMDCTGL